MRKIRIEYLVILVLFTMVLFQYRINKKVRNNNKINSEQFDYMLSSLSTALMSRCEIESSGLTRSIVLLDTTLSVISMSHILTEEPTLFLLFSDKDCSSCVDHALLELSDFVNSFDSKRVVILAQVSSIRAYLLQMKRFNINCERYFVEKSPFEFSRFGHKPFYFVMNNKLSPKLYFVPEKTLPELTKIYLNSIGEYI
jgi:hypothetical protein